MSGGGRTRRHPVDETLPAGKLAVYGFQHVLAFFAGGAIVIPILVASALGLTNGQLVHLINAALLTCGIASIIQSVGFWKVGVRLPLLQGVAFVAVSPMIAIGLGAGGGTQGLRTVYGAVIVCGLITFAIAPLFSRVVRFFPPVVTGSVITIIGLALLPVAAASAAGGDGPSFQPGSARNMAYALGTLAVIVLVHKVSRGFLSTVGVLLGLALGTTVAWALGDTDFHDVAAASWLGLSTPFHFGIPQFSVGAVITMMVVMLITAIETTGAVFAVSEIVDRPIRGDDLARAMRADGLSVAVGGTLNSFPYTCFSENVGLVRLTRVRSRWVISAAGVFMILLGLVPKFAAAVTAIPNPVLGGASLAMFAMVSVVGFQILSRVDFGDHRNSVIVAASIGVAMYVTAVPQVKEAVPDWAQIFVGSGITLGALTAIALNLLFHHLGRRRRTTGQAPPHAERLRLEHVNTMTAEEFTTTFASLYQGPTEAVDRAYSRRPFTDANELRAALQEAFFDSSEEDLHRLLACYPDLGGPTSASGDGDDMSLRDHSTPGLTQLAQRDTEQLAALTHAYRERFGFPLVMCLREQPHLQAVLATGSQRLHNTPAQERHFAVAEIARIADHRFHDLVSTETVSRMEPPGQTPTSPPAAAHPHHPVFRPPGDRRVGD
ncbi:solute carrier family 23 protein [Streptomyces cavernicola]|uniref:Solute carrier family 23 protein n=1 Tax=Streptomyces cavernicola TaxID=3043613 RepID=A0ABT6S560_9ACTN|nr:solute carrier family 23 protein [Streptomyces sp. B-S-A6]MDI3403233.1 solute carrier family 23 protein [Streptomyces sp. B-S-A6]